MDTNVIKQCTSQALAGQLTFPEIITKLEAIEVERYMVDLGRKMNHYYAVNGESSSHALDFKGSAIAPEFDAKALKSAIKDAQSDKIKYIEFLERAVNAGVCRYEVFITGKKIVYGGRKGEQHVEAFPTVK